MDNKPDEKDGKTDGKEGKDGKTDGKEGKDGKTDGKEGKDVKLPVASAIVDLAQLMKKKGNKSDKPADQKSAERTCFELGHLLTKGKDTQSVRELRKKNEKQKKGSAEKTTEVPSVVESYKKRAVVVESNSKRAKILENLKKYGGGGADLQIDITQQKSEQEEQNSIKKVVSKRERPAEVKGGSKREVSEFKRSYALAKTPPVHSMFLISKKDDELEQKLSESSKASQRRDVQAKHTRGQTAEGRHSQRQKAERKQSQRELEGKRSQRELERKQSQRELERKQPPAETKQSDPKQAQDSNLMYKPMYLYSPSARQVFRQTVSKLGLMTGKIMGTERRRKNDKTDPNNKAPDDNRADELLAQSPTVASTPPSKPVDMMDDNDYTSFEPTDAVRRPARAE